MRLSVLLLIGASLSPAALTAQDRPAQPDPIADNSFLLEEAYNQESGVVQHINAFIRLRQSNSWTYTFTQEWPLWGQSHQLSFTIPVQRVTGAGGHETGIGDIALNYRYQLVEGGRTAVAPRLSLLLPTGDERRELGAGGHGIQLNLPISFALSRRIVTHWNAGATLVLRAQNPVGARATTTAMNAGSSVVWHLRPTFDVLVEFVGARLQTVSGPSATTSSESLLLCPGFRWAHNFASGLQIVPGVAVPVGLGPSRGESGVLFYLSFEHPFRRGATGN